MFDCGWKSLPLGEGGTAKPCRMRDCHFRIYPHQSPAVTASPGRSLHGGTWDGSLCRQCRAGVYSRRILCYNTCRKCRGRVHRPIKARKYYDQSTFCLPREDLSQVTDAELCHLIPQFATGLPHLYYSHTTFENNHILPPT